MNNLGRMFHIWSVLYAKDQDPQSVIEAFFHEAYTQSVNGVILNRAEYIAHVIEQRKNIQTMAFECKIHMVQNDQLFILYQAKGSNIQGHQIIAEISAYIEFKDQKVYKIHGIVHLSTGNPFDVDMN